ncbi:conserved hypothetical protein [Crenothrix polyspora]|uniref:DUF502 domain-containing protein n=2 Tax=Crenothrix polyspora TaxID=360316 RepID=A0A1R4H2D7_9GAMM|nr:conserved hypothetical protein [Crenothrix polyspora]
MVEPFNLNLVGKNITMNQLLAVKMKPISKTFFKGLIAIIPLTLTLYLLFWLASTAELALGNIFKFFLPDNWYIHGFGFVLGLVVVFFFGSFLNSETFRSLFGLFEEMVNQIPIVKSIYSAIRDFSALFSSGKHGKFKQVVLVKVPHGNGQQIGFITVSDFEEISHTLIADDQIAVFLPFSYQMGGNTVIMSRENVLEIDLSVEDALRFIATAGVVGHVGDNKTQVKVDKPTMTA